MISAKVSFGKNMIIQNLLVTKIKRKIFDYLKIPSKMIRYTKRFNEAGFISLLFKDDEMSKEACEQNWDKIKNEIGNELDTVPIHNDRHIQNTVNSYNGKITSDF